MNVGYVNKESKDSCFLKLSVHKWEFLSEKNITLLEQSFGGTGSRPC